MARASSRTRSRALAPAASSAVSRTPPGEAHAGPRSSLEKMLDILDLFEERGEDGRQRRWTPEQMMQRLGCTRSTLYRYLRALADAGLVTSLPDIGYALGPRVAELDYEMRAGDPLIAAGRPLLQALVQEVPGVGLLCRYYRDRVLCVHQEHSAGPAELRSGYERGKPMPLARGSASRVILAHLRPQRLRRLYEAQPREFAVAGRNWAEVSAALARIRESGCCITRGEVTPGVIGIGAPVFDSEQAVIGSLSVTVRDAGMSERRLASAADRVKFSASVLSNAMRRGAD